MTFMCRTVEEEQRRSDPLDGGEYSPSLLWPGWISERDRADALTCHEGYVDEVDGLSWSATTDPFRLPATRSVVPEGVDALRELRFELRRPAVERFNDCMEHARGRAEDNCRLGMLPNGRSRMEEAMNDCMAMWVDGIGDQTHGSAVTNGKAHSVGGGVEAGPDWLKVNGGYEHQWTTELTSSRESTVQGYEGMRRRCARPFDDDGWMP
jgi:hypothetical protein